MLRQRRSGRTGSRSQQPGMSSRSSDALILFGNIRSVAINSPPTLRLNCLNTWRQLIDRGAPKHAATSNEVSKPRRTLISTKPLRDIHTDIDRTQRRVSRVAWFRPLASRPDYISAECRLAQTIKLQPTKLDLTTSPEGRALTPACKCSGAKPNR